jgi:acetyl esterase/lipase
MPHPAHTSLFVAALFASAVASAQAQRYESPIFEKVDIKSDVVFHTAKNVKGENEALKLDIYTPAGDTMKGRPAIVWFHGGGLRVGNDKKQGYVVSMSNEFAKRGYVCISADYRVREQPGQGAERMATLRDAVDDGRAALAWVRAHAAELGIDAQRIAIGGGSAGGWVATSLAALENNDAVKNKTAKLFAYVDLWGSPNDGFLYGNIDQDYPPTVIVHGTADQSVPFSNSEKLVATLNSKGVKHQLIPIPDAPHTPTTHLPEFVKTVSAFVAKALPAGKQK